MSDQEINIAIAEACGWTEIDGFSAKGLMGKPPDKLCSFDYLPDFCNDLNAIREAMELISQQCKESDYWFFLRQIIGFPDAESDWYEMYYFQAVNATARHRAEAFLRTIGKWKETTK